MDTVTTVTYSQAHGLVLTSEQGHRVHIKENLAGFMLAYSFSAPSQVPETGTPWQRVAAAAASRLADGIQSVVPMQLPTDDDVPEYGDHA